MSEREFGQHQRELELTGICTDPDFIFELRTMYNLAVQFDRDYWEDDPDADPNDLFENFTQLTIEVLQNIDNGIKVDGEMVSSEIDFIIDVLEGGDENDAFGTEGWRHQLGWD